MIDGIIKADGTSRLMRATLPETYAEFRAQCATGTQPLDVLFNAIGWRQLPTFLNKANLLKDDTAAAFGLGADAVPDDVFTKLVSALFNNEGLITDVNGNPVGTRVATGSYVGVGGWGSSTPTSLTFDFVPKFVMVTTGGGLQTWSGYPGLSYCFVWFEGNTEFLIGVDTNVISRNKNTLTWYLRSISGTTAQQQMDAAGATYYYFAIG